MKTCQVVGMSQSGSTLLFNIVRLILNKSETEYELTKDHRPSTEGVDFYIVSFRDIRDTTTSYYLKYKNCWLSAVESGEKNVKWMKECEALPKKKVLFYRYEDYQDDKIKQVKKLISFLKIKELADGEIKELISEAEGIIQSAPSSKANANQTFYKDEVYKETLMLKEHRTINRGKVGGYKDHLSGDQIRVLHEKFLGWIQQYGYKA